MGDLSAYEWRVLRDLAQDKRVERGASTQQAIEALTGNGYLLTTESNRKLVTVKGAEAIAAGEPDE